MHPTLEACHAPYLAQRKVFVSTRPWTSSSPLTPVRVVPFEPISSGLFIIYYYQTLFTPRPPGHPRHLSLSLVPINESLINKLFARYLYLLVKGSGSKALILFHLSFSIRWVVPMASSMASMSRFIRKDSRFQLCHGLYKQSSCFVTRGLQPRPSMCFSPLFSTDLFRFFSVRREFYPWFRFIARLLFGLCSLF